MVDNSVMQQKTSWWLLGEDRINDNSSDSKSLIGLAATCEGGPGRLSGRMELPQSGGSAGGGRGRLALPGFSGARVSQVEPRVDYI